MEFVDQRFTAAPNVCAVTKRGDDQLLDTGANLTGVEQRVYLRRATAEEIGIAVGMVPKAEVEELRGQVEEMAAKLAELDRIQDAIEASEDAEKELVEAVAASS